MAETVSVTIDSAKDNVQPTLEEEAAKYDSPAPEEEVARPEWLPEKFKSPEDLAKAYGELEKKMGSRQSIPAKEEEPEAEPAADNSSEDGTETAKDEEQSVEEQAREATEKAGLNFDKLSEKYWEQGELDESDYKALEKSGIPKTLVDQFIAGQEAILNTTRNSVFETVGGEDTYNAMTEWAAESLSKAEVDAYNRAVNSGDMNTVMMAVKGLEARYSAAEGFEPSRTVKGPARTGTSSVYRSIAELEKDMSNPKYKNDPAFRKDVEQKLSRSDIF